MGFFCSIISKRISNCAIQRLKMMGDDNFYSKVNPTTGAIEWALQEQEYDYHQEISRSAYADMLFDTDRNIKYQQAIRKAVKTVLGRGDTAHVLDIGTGTGLLSMMAASSDNKIRTVTACEAFKPMAKVASEIVKNNGFDVIKVVPKRSTDLTVGSDGDMQCKANILVTEIFDTELIGEGALPIYKHAHQNLLQDGCITVPHQATLTAQLVHSPLMRSWHALQPFPLPHDQTFSPPASFDSCPGATSVAHDIQLNQVPRHHFQAIAEPCHLLNFPFYSKELSLAGSNSVEVEATGSGECQAVLMWWSLDMDVDGQIVLSMAPDWALPATAAGGWRDHWIQAVYFLKEPLNVTKGERIKLTASHDDYRIWFDAQKMAETVELETPAEAAGGPALCGCGAHIAWSRTRLGMLNDKERQRKYTDALQKIVQGRNCLCFSDCSLIPVISAKLGAKTVFTLEKSSIFRDVQKTLIESNQVENKVTVIQKPANELTEEDFDAKMVEVIVGEPFFNTSLLPWHNLCFWYQCTAVSRLASSHLEVMPLSAHLKAAAVTFEHLWKIRAPVGSVEGFNVKPFDDMVQDSMSWSDRGAEPQPLWEYPSSLLTETFDLLTFDFTHVPSENMQVKDHVQFKRKGICHAVVLWMEYNLDGLNKISTGLQPDGNWDMHSKQAVYFMTGFPCTTTANKLHYNATFKPKSGDLDFVFTVSSSGEK